MIGFPGAFVAGLLGMVVGGQMIPSPGEGDYLALVVRLVVIGLGAMTGAAVGWVMYQNDRYLAVTLLAVSLAGSVIAGWIALEVAEATVEGPDAFNLVKEISRRTVLGAALGATLAPLMFSVLAPRRWLVG